MQVSPPPSPEVFYLPRLNPAPINTNSPPPPPALVPILLTLTPHPTPRPCTHPTFYHYRFYYSRTSYEWNHVIFVALCLVYLLSYCCSVTKSCPTLCDPMDCGTPDFLVLHQLLELAQIHVHWVSDGIQSSHPLSSPSPPASNLPQHQSIFQWVGSL